MKRFYRALAAPLLLLVVATSVDADISGATRVASGLSNPLFATYAPGDKEHLFIVQKNGVIRVLDLTQNGLLPTPFLNVAVDTASEGGLLGLAFHPDYQNNGKFYVNATIDNGGIPFQGNPSDFSTHIREYTVSSTNPYVANSTPTEILSFLQPQDNHNGGWIGFGPDNYLYIASGDGGGGGDTGSGHTPGIGNSQDLYLENDGSGSPARNLLGKMLRIDVNSDGFPAEPDRNYAVPADNPLVGGTIYDDEIWAYGLRNPFRNSFDRKTGDLWIADVGQGSREEINFQAADSEGGENYAWRRREGFFSYQGGQLLPGDTQPVYDYGHGGGTFQGNSVTGGYVYRGPDPELRGQYFFGDFSSSNIWTFDPANPSGTVARVNPQLGADVGSIGSPSSFGEDADGNLYVVDYFGGEVFRIRTDIQIPGDYDGNGIVEEADYTVWRDAYGLTGLQIADGNGDEVVDAADYNIWRDNLGRTLPPPVEFITSAPEPGSVLLLLTGTALTLGRRQRPRVPTTVGRMRL